MSRALGDTVISDFDGTLAQLPIAWHSLREALSIERIGDLWEESDPARWAVVTRAEVEAARIAPPVRVVVEALGSVAAVAVLTNNDETAVETFLDRWPELRAKVGTIVGRRALGGPKSDFEVFSAGYARCVAALAGAAGRPQIAYVGDMSYELDYARRLGATAFDVKDLDAASRGPRGG